MIRFFKRYGFATDIIRITSDMNAPSCDRKAWALQMARDFDLGIIHIWRIKLALMRNITL